MTIQNYLQSVLYTIFQLYYAYTNINLHGNIIKDNHGYDDFNNERTHFFIKNISLTLYSWKGDVGCEWEMSWRRGQTAILTQVLLATIAALLPRLGWSCSTVGHWGPKALCLPLALTSASCLQLTRTAPGTWLYYCLTSTCFRCSSAYLHRCISWLTARSRVSI